MLLDDAICSLAVLEPTAVRDRVLLAPLVTTAPEIQVLMDVLRVSTLAQGLQFAWLVPQEATVQAHPIESPVLPVPILMLAV